MLDELPEAQTILIVDDSPENLTILGALLRSEYQIRVATSGEKALKILESDNLPDLIILDVIMPGLDGYEVCKRIKADSRTRDIPVIFITGKSNEEDQVKGFEAGAVDYVAKPFSPVITKARVRTHTELKRFRDALVKASYLDGLTTIANRRRFDEYYATTWYMAMREKFPLSLIMVDIDNFKVFNDYYGHQEGDACLIRVAKTLAETTKRSTDLVARYGGEEFVCVLPGAGNDGAFAVAENFRNRVRSLQIPHAVSSVCGYVTISLGVATAVPTKDLSSEVVIKAADEALYEAKDNGKDRTCGVEFENLPD